MFGSSVGLCRAVLSTGVRLARGIAARRAVGVGTVGGLAAGALAGGTGLAKHPWGSSEEAPVPSTAVLVLISMAEHQNCRSLRKKPWCSHSSPFSNPFCKLDLGIHCGIKCK